MNNITPEIRKRVYDLYYAWLDQITIRGHSKWGSARYNKADEKAEALENEASLLVFGDTNHTATEAYEEKEAE
jgi:hypothetical protein